MPDSDKYEWRPASTFEDGVGEPGEAESGEDLDGPDSAESEKDGRLERQRAERK